MWKPYINNRLITERDGYYLIKPDWDVEHIPISCSVCDSLYRDRDDELAHNKFGCCSFCATQFAYINAVAWSNGWRPDKKAIQDSLARRRKISVIVGDNDLIKS